MRRWRRDRVLRIRMGALPSPGMQPPNPPRRPVTIELHGDRYVDEYQWLRQRDDAVIAHLEAENAYTAAATAHLTPLQETILSEIRSRVEETDVSAPARKDDFWYGRRTVEGSQYPIYVRWADDPAVNAPGGAPGDEPVDILDQNLLAADAGYCGLGVRMISPDHALLAYSVDHTGNESFQLRFRDLDRGEDLADVVDGTYYGGAWSADGTAFFYTTIDAAHRPFRAWRHRLGSPQSADVLVHEEDDERFWLDVAFSRDQRYALILLASNATSEVLAVDTADPDCRTHSVMGRREGVRYRADHKDGRWLVVTDHDAPNGRLVAFPVDDPAAVVDLIGHDLEVKIAEALPFADHVVVLGRRHGDPMVRVLPDHGDPHDLDFAEPGYSLGRTGNLEYAATRYRFTHESLITPLRVVDADLGSGEQHLVKETPAPNYRPEAYVQRRVWVEVGEVAVPITVAYRGDLELPAPTLLYGYGAYESVLDPWFDPALFSLLDRGVVYAVAHVRGGGEMGRSWHLDGRMAAKANTFTDFIACAEHLIEAGIALPGRLAARGVSAGGLLMGAVTTMRPDLWAAVVAEVPFVDVLNTMADPTIPLTVAEWEEWGNPALAEDYSWMAAYSPYEHTVAADYPAILATAGLDDSRVAYWEPAKWVARLRDVTTGARPILLKTEMGAGHSGPSGRYDAWRAQAFILAFVLDRLIAGPTHPPT